MHPLIAATIAALLGVSAAGALPLADHIARVEAGRYGDPSSPAISAKLALYCQALDHRTLRATFTGYHPDEASGGGWQTALSDSLVAGRRPHARTDIAAAARSWFRTRGSWPGWQNAQLWVEGWGLVTIRDCGSGWQAKLRFDLCQRTVREAQAFSTQPRRMVVLDDKHAGLF